MHTEFDFIGGSHLADGVERVSSSFVVTQPWAIAQFGSATLRPGWWRFECVGESDKSEVRLSSKRDPLIIFQAGNSAACVYLGEPGGYQIALLVSPWPGTYQFSTLRLVRLNGLETGKLFKSAASRLIKRKGALKLLLRASRQLISGRALGLALSAPSPLTTSHQATNHNDHGELGPKTIVLGDVTLHARQGDHLHSQAAQIVKLEFESNPNLMALYADVIEAGQLIPHPAWDVNLSASGAYDNAPLFLRRGSHTNNIQDAVTKWGTDAVGRIPLPLVKRGAAKSSTWVRMERPRLSPLPLVSAIIPTKFRIDLSDLTGYPNLEIVVVDNGVTDARFGATVAAARESFPVRIVEDKGSFNFSRLVNSGVNAARGEIILLLNDDVEPLSAGWLHHMVESALSSEVGAVGACLIYPDRTIQHAGVVLGLGGTCAHLWRGVDEAAAANNPYILSPGGRMAVTGACLAVRRAEYEAVGGFDESAFPVAYNDIDFCLRLHARGLRNIYRGDVKLVHHESQSRGYDDVTVEKRKRQSAEAALFIERWGHLIQADPYFSPAFDPSHEIGVAHQANFVSPDYYVPI